ncbi:MAG TPA: iron-sulfur cluster assembly protein [Candidatus Thermoplasmatota archaeon]|nr:iron-sulfur cluster assembly protein [Candidatus Thermoplasmatota archaeon]
MRPLPEERHAPVTLGRGLAVVTIPDGKEGHLDAGTVVTVSQTLGTSYTVKTERGAKYRIRGEDGDAIGQPRLGSSGPVKPRDGTAAAVEEMARRLLGKVFDPEIPVDVVNLGLVHEVKAEPVGGGWRVKVRMGLTSPGCGMGDVLVRDVKDQLSRIEGVAEVDAQVVLFPVWNPNTMMSDAAKLKLGML